MNKLGIRMFYIIAPFCIDVGLNGFLRGYIYLRFVKYTGIMGNLISAFALIMGMAAIYLYFWMIVVIEGKKQIKVYEVVGALVTSSFIYFFIMMLLFSYISNKIYIFDNITYFSISTILLLLCLYGQVQLEEKLLKIMERKGIKRD